ncbi:MAG: SIR2 family protein [Lentimicrobiaceae bacterium]|jgi:hypothetical protein
MKETKYIFWFGAGISIPSKMPSGYCLTDKWLNYFLPNEEYTSIIKFYEKQKKIVGKEFPRLEKIIDDSLGVFGSECLQVLEFMKEIAPNKMHIAISNYLLRNKTYAFTTNFDVGIEKSNAGKIKTHSLTKINSNNWGLVKIHGCIQENNNNWGITIKNLQNGLATWISDLLINLLISESNTFVFIGYSSSDYFDVIPFFQRIYREKISLNSKVIWVHHIDELDKNLDITNANWEEDLSWGAKEILESFKKENIIVKEGKSEQILADLIPDYFIENVFKTEIKWSEGWEKYIIPTCEQKKKFAFKFYSSIGNGKKSLSLLPDPNEINYYNYEIQNYLNSLRDCGYYETEFRIRKQLKHKKSDFSRIFFTRHYIVSFRLSGRIVRAFLMYTFYLIKYSNSKKFYHDQDNKNSVMLLIAESGLLYQSFLHKIPRNLFMVLLTLPIEHIIRRLMLISVILYQKYSKNNSLGNDPHLKAIINRVNDLLTIPIFQAKHFFGLLNRFDFNNKNGLDFTDFTDGLYVETDSFLGVVNFQRNRASNNFRYLHLGLFFPKKNEFNEIKYSEIEDAINISLKTAELIKDFPGQIKAYHMLSILALYKRNFSNYLENREKYRNMQKILEKEEIEFQKQKKYWR